MLLKPLKLISLPFLFVLLFMLVSGCGGNDKKEVEDSKPSAVVNQKNNDTKSNEKSSTETALKKRENQTSFKWEKLRGWHTQSPISRTTPINITFNKEVFSDDMIGKDASNIMHITPTIKGIPLVQSKTEIVWKTEKSLEANIDYKISILAKGLDDVANNAAPFQFTLKLVPLEFEIQTSGLTTIPDSENKMLLKGSVLISDVVKNEDVKQVLKATQQDKTLPIEWSHTDKTHNFIISNITRETFDSDIKIKWDGKTIGIDSKGQKEIAVPNINLFRMTSMRVVYESATNPYVQIRFSDELDSTQNLKGLVELAKNKYTVSIDKNLIKIFPRNTLTGQYKVRIHQGIKSQRGKVLSKKIEKELTFNDIKPQVRFANKGNILPQNSVLDIPFEAVGIHAIEVSALEIYPENMGFFLQQNNLSGNNSATRSGRFLWRKTIQLNPANPNQWNRYSFNVTDLMKKYHSGLLQLSLRVLPQHSSYRCPTGKEIKPVKDLLKNMEDNGVYIAVEEDSLNDENNSGYRYNWKERNNPCKSTYFNNYYNNSKLKVSQNFIASNIGLITKQDANGKLRIISTDIKTAEPLTGVELEVKDYQGQSMATATTDGSGFAEIELDNRTPFLLVAKKFEDTAYLKLNARTALPVSHFNVGGQKIKKGIKGIIYGERGVWRPGDDIFLTFVLEDKLEKIPQGHPVTMKLIDPRGKVFKTQTSVSSVGGFYAFKFKTDEESETGNWMAKAYLGGSTFSKSLSIETVRPNRLKLELTFENPNEKGDKETGINHGSNDKAVIYSSNGTPKGKLFSQWLHGATASNLKADISVRFAKMKTKFENYPDYTFDDPARDLKSADTMLLEGRLDDDGYLKFKKKLQPESKAPGVLNARFTTRVFEKGGAFSISRSSMDYYPYENFVGLKLPKSESSYPLLYTDKKQTLQISSVNAKGENISLEKVRVSLYKIRWHWWWNRDKKSLAEYADGKHTDLLDNVIVRTVDGKGDYEFMVPKEDWGRHLIRVCDLEGKHCAGKTVYLDWPYWAGRAQKAGSSAASRLNLFSDKEAYSVGETAVVEIPSAAQGRALLTVETGSKILRQEWIKLDDAAKDKQGKVKVEIPISAEMAPNAYVHVSLLQPHQDKKNDRPIRLYGIIPLEVADPETYLKPKIVVDEEWKPESKQTITVSETTGKDMNYTLAVVDEGLLGLTAFRTPNLHRYFYSKEALGIKTWDLFDNVVGAYGGKLERMLALGGGDDAAVDNEDSKKRRFPPVVKFLGPFKLLAGETKKHEIELPPYLGAVRVMLVAGDKGAYGKAQESVFIRQPLMLQASLPRVLGPDEEVAVPLTIFAMNKDIKNVKITVTTDDMANIVNDGNEGTQLKFDKMGEKVAFIKIKTAKKEGKTHLHFSAIDMDNPENTSEADIHLNIRRANEASSRLISTIIEPGGNWQAKANAFGLDGTNEAVLELSSVPSLNLEDRLNYLIRYPHGCLEQTTSSVFPQLYLSNVMDLSDDRKKDIESYVESAIKKLKRFTKGSGDFSYWPGEGYSSDWASLYAGHFLLEAKNKGYDVPANMLTNWLNFQIDLAQNHVVSGSQYTHVQAYRLYVLAVAGKPQLGAMNRFRELGKSTHGKLNDKARWLLASAYKKASQPEAAKEVIQGLLINVEKVERSDDTYSSTLGDLGLQLESLVTLDKKQDANVLLEQISNQMQGKRYQSTQGIAWALMGVSHYLGGDTGSFSATVSENNKPQKINSEKSITSISLKDAGADFKVDNSSGIKLFATLVNTGVPDAGTETSIEKGLLMNVTYEVRDKEDSKKWNEIESQQLQQGSDIRISVTVTNDTDFSAKNIALTIPVAAGMEILTQTSDTPVDSKDHSNQIDHRDIRDDRIHYYFSLEEHRSYNKRRNENTKTFQLIANASFKGRYYLPAINVEAMYDGNLKAREKGKWIEIVSDTGNGKQSGE
ncbi:MAG: MG2 domain-containing protein [Cocleimonas sp.]